MNKNKLLPLTILIISFLSTFSVKANDIVRGTTNNETLNGYRSFELGEAILLFMPDKNMESVGWDYRLDAPVIWLTEGYTETGSYEKFTEKAFRKGLMRINVDGVQSTILRKTKEELAWRVRYSTDNEARFGVESITLSIDGGISDETQTCFGNLYSNCVFDAKKSMEQSGIHFKKICEQFPSYVGYELTHPDKRKTLFRTVYSGGSGGEESWVEVHFSKKEKDLCKGYSEEVAEDAKEEKKKETIAKKSKTSKKPKTAKEICNDVSSLAKSVMSVRQHGVSMSKAMEVVDSKLAESFVVDAYSKSSFSTEQYQDKAIREFSDEAYLSCIKTLPRD